MTSTELIPYLWYLLGVVLMVVIGVLAPHVVIYLRTHAAKLEAELHLTQMAAAERLWWRLLQPELGALAINAAPILERLGAFVASATGLPASIVVAFGSAISNELLQAWNGQTPTVTPPAPPPGPTGPSPLMPAPQSSAPTTPAADPTPSAPTAATDAQPSEAASP